MDWVGQTTFHDRDGALIVKFSVCTSTKNIMVVKRIHCLQCAGKPWLVDRRSYFSSVITASLSREGLSGT